MRELARLGMRPGVMRNPLGIGLTMWTRMGNAARKCFAVKALRGEVPEVRAGGWNSTGTNADIPQCFK
jgi:hypothetical protein